MERSSKPQVYLAKVRAFFAIAKREEIENVRTKRYDDKEMVRRLASGLMRLASEEEVDET